MCDLCKNDVQRTYAHSRTQEHKKRLFAVMKILKQKSLEQRIYK